MKKRMVLWLGLCLTIVAVTYVQGALPFFPLSEVRPGQKGVGYTVVAGTEIRPFAVEILGLTQSRSLDRAFILVRVSGTALRDSKGIAAGMSGSPVFINERLAGAISYAFDRSDPQYGLVTPIEDMLRLWERELPAEAVVLAPSPLLPRAYRIAVPVSTPLLLSGRRVPAELDQLAGRLGLTLVAAEGALGISVQDSPPVQPGSAVAAVFAYGDYTAAVIGTVTWVDGRRFLAFGHPIANRGDVDYLATGVYVHRVIASQDMPFKIGMPLSQIGRFIQDRGAGAGGLLKEAADAVVVKAIVQDKGSGRHGEYQTALAREPVFLRAMCLAALLDAMDRTFDQYTAGTARVMLKIEGEGLAEPLVRRNLFHDNGDIATIALSEVGEAIDLLYRNTFQRVWLRSVHLEVSFTPALLVASVIGARADRERVRPGEQVRVDVELKPFRAASRTVSFTITVPARTPPGKLVLTVRGGYAPTRKDEEDEQGGLTQFIHAKPAASLAEEVEAFVDRPRNNDLILEYLPPAGDLQEGGPGREPILQMQGCDFIVKGEAELVLEVQAPSS